jgi:hypothetical protein
VVPSQGSTPGACRRWAKAVDGRDLGGVRSQPSLTGGGAGLPRPASLTPAPAAAQHPDRRLTDSARILGPGDGDADMTRTTP